MTSPTQPIQVISVRGPTTAAGLSGRRVTPESRAIQVRLPGGGFVWHWPTGVLIEDRDGRARRIRILDMTRLAQLSLLAYAATAWLVRWKGARR